MPCIGYKFQSQILSSVLSELDSPNRQLQIDNALFALFQKKKKNAYKTLKQEDNCGQMHEAETVKDCSSLERYMTD